MLKYNIAKQASKNSRNRSDLSINSIRHRLSRNLIPISSEIVPISISDNVLRNSQEILANINDDNIERSRIYAPPSIISTSLSSVMSLSTQSENESFSSTENQQTPSNEEEEMIGTTPVDFLRHWIVKFNVNRVACNHLLKYLHHNFDATIKTDYRSLLNTPRNSNLFDVDPGKAIYLGFSENFILLTCNFKGFVEEEEIKLLVNIDGAPVI